MIRKKGILAIQKIYSILPISIKERHIPSRIHAGLLKMYSRLPFGIRKTIYLKLVNPSKNGVPRNFPFRCDYGVTYIGDSIFNDYFVQYYEETFIPETYSYVYKTETVKARKYSGNVEIAVEHDSVLPLSINEVKPVSVDINGTKFFFQDFIPHRFHYLPVSKGDMIKIDTKNDIIVGDLLQKHQVNPHKYKRIICIFIDGLTSEIFQEHPLEEIMPNTYAFFQKGLIFNNCYSTAEWTVPSLANIFSGKYTTNHGIFSPKIDRTISIGSKLLSEYLRGNNYLTFLTSSSHGHTPSYGYIKGYDRTIYRRWMDCKGIIGSFFENERAFNGRDIFSWCTFFDIHHMLNGIPSLKNQTELSIAAHDYYEKSTAKSVFKPYDEIKKERYIRMIEDLDYHLKSVYDYIDSTFNDEALVMLCSDHGQAYLSNDTHPLSDCRTRVAFMIRGKDLPCGSSDEFIETIDILPTVLKMAGIDSKEDIDGKVPKILGGKTEREFVFSESIYPGQTYKVIIRGKENKFSFETIGRVNEDGKVDMSKYTVLLNYTDGRTGSRDINQQTDEYVKIVMEHMKNHQS